ncbi:cytochrome P450 [Aspergillus undulatus]|uniref:cytochrome P450 n=1 Tax=Aspergillus undulatus TaxID=1810928 RepID=UPI003CCDFBC0
MGIAASLCSALLLLLWYRVCVRLSVDKSRKESWQNIVLVEPSIYILKFVRGLEYLWNGPEILRQVHSLVKDKDMPYAIPTPETYQVHFSSAAHIKQLIQAPDTHLSLHALAKDTFQPRYTMNGLAVDDCMSANGTIHQRALQASLRSHLRALSQPLSECIARTLTKELAIKSGDGELLADGWRALQIFPLAKRLIVSANALVFFGEEVSSDPTFLKAALEYPEHMMETAEALRLIPSWLAPLVAPFLMRGHRAVKILLDYLTPVVEGRLLNLEQHLERKVDCIQFFVNAVVAKKQRDKWPAQRIVQVLLGIWFASVHQPAMCLFYALDDLCLHPQYIQALRDEVSVSQTMTMANNEPGIDINTCPLLDAFLKESARLNPTDSISVRRKVLQPYTLSDGTRLAKDDVACISLQPILQSPENYTDPLTFNPYRFMKSTSTKSASSTSITSSSSKFTDADVTFPIWGLGKHACPGRHYASLLLKLVLAHILHRYEIKMADGKAEMKKRSFYWRSAIVPRSGAILYFRERKLPLGLGFGTE